MRSLVRFVVVGVLVGALGGPLTAVPALAHAELVKSDPADGASLDQAPAEVRAWFSEELDPDASLLMLQDAHGQMVGLEPGHVDLMAADRDVMLLKVPRLEPGTYRVQWHAVAADDGGVSEDSFTFTVGMAAQPGGHDEHPAGQPVSSAGLRLATIEPNNGATIDEDHLHLHLRVEGMILDDEEAEGHGHLHAHLDGKPVPITADSGDAYIVHLEGIEAGKHTLELELNRNDDRPLDPEVTAHLDFTLAEGAGMDH